MKGINSTNLITDIADIDRVRFNVKEVPMKYYPDIGFKEKNHPNVNPFDTKDYKCLVNDQGKLISVVGSKYKLVKNGELIDALFDRLKETGFEYNLSGQDSYFTEKRMRLHFTFPELKLKDSNSDIPLSLWIHNSYNYTEGVRIAWGAFRLVCSNGMIIGKMLKRFYHKHSKGFYLPHLGESFEKAYKQIPEINDRIKLLERETFTDKDIEELNNTFSEGFLKKAIPNISDSMLAQQSKWFVINLLTYYISHTISLQQRYTYQQKLTKITGI